MIISAHITPYRNPYAAFIHMGKDSLLRASGRFKVDVRLPLPGEFGVTDPFAPMRRFRQDVSPPRFSPINPTTGEPIPSARKNWDINPPRNLFASEAYKGAQLTIPKPLFVDARR
ncbi:MAG: hypothetical protein N2316_12335 [Spirochaetes bacterium]|nr:hypothetical protein [Spirochaetota bacterium]